MLILILILILVISLGLLVTNRLDPLYFWILIIISAVFAYWVLPRINRTPKK